MAAAASILSGPAGAQRLRPQLDYASAAVIRDQCIAWATERHLSVAIAVFDRRGAMLAFAQMDGAPTAVGAIAQWKGKSAAMMEVTTAETADWGGSAPDIANWRGGVPIFTAEGVSLGGVGASGAESEEDESCGRAGIAAAGLADGPPVK